MLSRFGVTGGRLLVVALLVHVVIGARAVSLSGDLGSDFLRYFEIATASGRPYVDYQVEYPIGALAIVKTLALVPGGSGSFGLAMVCTNLLADAVVVLALLWGWGAIAAAYFSVAVIPILDLLLNRLDLWSVAAATVAVAAWRRDRLVLTAVAAVIGGSFKLWPLLFLVLLVVPRRGRVAGTPAAMPLVVGAIVAGAIAAGWAWISGWHGLYEVVTFRGARGWQIESVVGALVHLFGTGPPRLESGSWRIGSINGPISILMFVIAAPLSVWSVWQGGRTAHVGRGWLAAVTSLLLLSTLLSTQFVGWLIPGAAIAWAEGDRRLALVTVLAVLLTVLVFPILYERILDGQTFPLIIVVLRNAVLAALAISALVALRGVASDHVTPTRLNPAVD